MTARPGLGSVASTANAALIVVCGVMPIALLAAFAVRIEETLSISDARVGALLSIYFGVSVALAVPAGRLADRLGPKRATIVAATLTATALLGTAALAESYPVMIGFFIIGGAGQSLAAPTSNVVLAGGTTEGRLGVSMGIKQSSVPLGSFIAGLAVAATASGGWRWPFALAALIPAAAVLSTFAKRPAVERRGRESADDSMQIATLRKMWRFTLGAALSTFTASAIVGFLVLGLVDGGLGEGNAGVVLTIAGLMSVSVRIGSGLLRDRLQFKSVTAVSVLLLVGAGGFLLLTTAWTPLAIAGAVVAYGAGWGWPAMYHLALVEKYPMSPGRATGFARLGLAGGNSAGPLVFGILFETLGYRVGWLIAGIGMVGAAMLIRSAGSHSQGAGAFG